MNGTDLRLKTFANVAANNRFRSLYVSDLEIVERRQADLIAAVQPRSPDRPTARCPPGRPHVRDLRGPRRAGRSVLAVPDHPSRPGSRCRHSRRREGSGRWHQHSLRVRPTHGPTSAPMAACCSLSRRESSASRAQRHDWTLQGTFSGLISGWDIAFRDALDSSVWRVQAYGADLPNLPLQVPGRQRLGLLLA